MRPSAHVRERVLRCADGAVLPVDRSIVPPIVELVADAEAAIRACDVPLDRPLFHPEPPSITLQCFRAFKTYELVVNFRNMDKVARKLYLEPINSPFFSVHGWKNDSLNSGKVAPGMEVAFIVRFRPEENIDYVCSLVCVTEREKFTVPIKATGARGVLDLSDEVTFADAPVRYTSTKTLLARNIGNAPAKFTISAQAPFSVTPNSGFLEVSQTLQIDVCFTPKQVGSFESELQVDYSTGERVAVRAVGTAENINIKLERNHLRMENTSITLSSSKTLKIFNHSDTMVKFKWKKFSNEMEEEHFRAKQLLLVVKEEQEERRALLAKIEAGQNTESTDLCLLSQKYKSQSRVINDQAFLLDDQLFRIEPIDGIIWPGSFVEVRVHFSPTISGDHSRIVYCDVEGRESRLPLQLKGEALPPRARFSYDLLDLENIFVNTTHKYEVVLENKGEIPTHFMLTDSNTLFSPKFTFNPREGSINLGEQRVIEIAFCSDVLGEFSEEFRWDIRGSPDPLLLSFKGTVVGPTFHFNVPSVDFGKVSYGFPVSRQLSLFNVSHLPMTYSLRLENQADIENLVDFQLTAQRGCVPEMGSVEITVLAVPKAIQLVDFEIIVDIENVCADMLRIQVHLEGIVPEITATAPIVNMGDCYLSYSYFGKIELVNDSKFHARYQIQQQDENAQSVYTYTTESFSGIIEPHSRKPIDIEMQMRRLGQATFPIFIRVEGRANTPIAVDITANGIGPNVKLSARELNWGKIPVLKRTPHVLTLTNDSPIVANFSCMTIKESTVFTVSPLQGVIQPGAAAEVTVTAHLDDTIKFTDILKVGVQSDGIHEIQLAARGQGTTIVFDDGLRNIDFKDVFSNCDCSVEFVLSNMGRRAQTIHWTREESRMASTRDPNIEPSQVFEVIPSRFTLRPGAHQAIFIRGYSNKAANLREKLVCQAMIEKEPTRKAIIESTVIANFINPLIDLRPNVLRFESKHTTEESFNALEQKLSMRNTTTLPLTISFKCPAPFSVCLPEPGLCLGPQEFAIVPILYDPSFNMSRISTREHAKLTISYREHPQRDIVELFSEISFPNLTFSTNTIKFGCIEMDQEQRRTMTISNSSILPVTYQWYFLDHADRVTSSTATGADPSTTDTDKINCEPISQVFDIQPLRGVLEPGEKQEVEVYFYGCVGRRFDIKALCDVAGGPKYELNLQGEASMITFAFDKTALDFGTQSYQCITEQEIVLSNLGLVTFDYSTIILPSALLDTKLMISPAQGTIGPKGRQKITVRFCPCVPETVNNSFFIQIGHFEPTEIRVVGTGIAPRLSIDIPRVSEPRLEHLQTDLAQKRNKTTDPADIEAEIDRQLLIEKTREYIAKLSDDLHRKTSVSDQQKTRFAGSLLLYHKGVQQKTSKDRHVINLNESSHVRLSKYLCDFGTVIRSTTSKRTFKIFNRGIHSVSFSLEKSVLAGSGFSIEPDKAKSLPCGESLDFTVTINARTHVSDIVDVDLPIMIVNGPTIVVCLRAAVTVPELKFSSDRVDFGEILCGYRKTMFVQLHNPNAVVCDWSIHLSDAESHSKKHRRHLGANNSHEFEVHPTNGSLQPLERSYIMVHFSPTEERDCELMLPFKVAMNSKPFPLRLYGRGIRPMISFSPESIAVGPILPYSDGIEARFTVHNLIKYPLEIFSVDFDHQYIEEEQMLRQLCGHDTMPMFLPPREPGVSLTDSLMDSGSNRVRAEQVFLQLQAQLQQNHSQTYASHPHAHHRPSHTPLPTLLLSGSTGAASQHPTVPHPVSQASQVQIPPSTQSQAQVSQTTRRDAEDGSNTQGVARRQNTFDSEIPAVNTVDTTTRPLRQNTNNTQPGVSVVPVTTTSISQMITNINALAPSPPMLNGSDTNQIGSLLSISESIFSVVLHGSPFCGRTTQAKRIASHYGKTYVNIDEVIESVISTSEPLDMYSGAMCSFASGVVLGAGVSATDHVQSRKDAIPARNISSGDDEEGHVTSTTTMMRDRTTVGNSNTKDLGRDDDMETRAHESTEDARIVSERMLIDIVRQRLHQDDPHGYVVDGIESKHVPNTSALLKVILKVLGEKGRRVAAFHISLDISKIREREVVVQRILTDKELESLQIKELSEEEYDAMQETDRMAYDLAMQRYKRRAKEIEDKRRAERRHLEEEQASRTGERKVDDDAKVKGRKARKVPNSRAAGPEKPEKAPNSNKTEAKAAKGAKTPGSPKGARKTGGERSERAADKETRATEKNERANTVNVDKELGDDFIGRFGFNEETFLSEVTFKRVESYFSSLDACLSIMRDADRTLSAAAKNVPVPITTGNEKKPKATKTAAFSAADAAATVPLGQGGAGGVATAASGATVAATTAGAAVAGSNAVMGAPGAIPNASGEVDPHGTDDINVLFFDINSNVGDESTIFKSLAEHIPNPTRDDDTKDLKDVPPHPVLEQIYYPPRDSEGSGATVGTRTTHATGAALAAHPNTVGGSAGSSFFTLLASSTNFEEEDFATDQLTGAPSTLPISQTGMPVSLSMSIHNKSDLASSVASNAASALTAGQQNAGGHATTGTSGPGAIGAAQANTAGGALAGSTKSSGATDNLKAESKKTKPNAKFGEEARRTSISTQAGAGASTLAVGGTTTGTTLASAPGTATSTGAAAMMTSATHGSEIDEEAERESIHKFRWVLQPNERRELCVKFNPTDVGKFEQTLSFEAVGWRSRFTLSCHGLCQYYHITTDYRKMFHKWRRHKDDKSAIHGEYIVNTGTYEFGPLLFNKPRERYMERFPENRATVNVTNPGNSEAKVTFALRGDIKGDVFFFEPATMDLAPGQIQVLSIWAYPRTNSHFEDLFVMSVKDNPEPHTFKVSCIGVKPELEIDKKSLSFDKLLLGRIERREIKLKNPTHMAVGWKLVGVDALGDEFTVSPVEGVIDSFQEMTVTAEFKGIKAVVIKRVMRLEVCDVDKLSGVTQDVPILVTAEAYDIAVDLHFPKGFEGGLDFGVLKVFEEGKQLCTLKNKGKYEVGFRFLFDGGDIADYFFISPAQGVIQPSDKPFFVQVMFKANVEVSSKDNSSLKCVVFEPTTGEVTGSIPIKISARSVFSKFSVLPVRDLNFGALVHGTKSTRQFNIENLGEFDFRYSIYKLLERITEPKNDGKPRTTSRLGGKPSRTGSPPPTAKIMNNRKEVVKQADTMNFGAFTLFPTSGVVTPGTKQAITVEFHADSPGSYEEIIGVDVSDRSPVDSVDVLEYRLVGESCVPGVNTTDFASIFEEQNVCKRLELFNTQSSVYAEEDRVFYFGAYLAGQQVQVHFKISNPFKVSCDIGFSTKPRGKSKSDSTDFAFDVEPKKLTIPSHEYRYISVTFHPTSIQSYAGVFEAMVENVSEGRNKTLAFELRGEGTLPRVMVEKPSLRSKTGLPLLKFRRLLVGSLQTLPIVLRNDGIIPAKFKLEWAYKDTDDFDCALVNTYHNLKPQELRTIDIKCRPTGVRKFDAELRLKVLDNSFEDSSIQVVGEGYIDDVTFEGLPEDSENELSFAECYIGESKQLNFRVCNHSLEWIRMSISEAADFVFSPAVAHIRPRSDREVIVTFSPKQPTEIQHVPFTIRTTKIRLAAAQDIEWDDRMRIVRGVGNENPGARAGIATRKVLEHLPEPASDPLAQASEYLLNLSAFADYLSYECDVTTVNFKSTMMFQNRVYRFSLRNPGKVLLKFAFVIYNEDGSAAVEGSEDSPFSLMPSSGSIPANDALMITLRFSPMGVGEYRGLLVCNIPNLAKDQKPLQIQVHGTSLRPFCHFELEDNDYITSERRNPDRGAADGIPAILEPNTKVMEFSSCGVRSKNTKRFYIVNPTNMSYEYVWSLESMQTGKIFKCHTPRGIVAPGKKSEIIFEFNPESIDIKESLWTFTILDHGIRVPFLLVGQAVEPNVYADHSGVNFKSVLVGRQAREIVKLVNEESLPFSFSFNETSVEMGTDGTPVLRFSPTSGTIGPQSEMSIEIVFSPSSEKTFNFNLVCNIRRKPMAVTINVKGEGYEIHDSLQTELADGTLFDLGSGQNAENFIDFGQVQLNEKRVKRITVINSGKFNFDFAWKLPNKNSGSILTISPEIGTVVKGERTFCEVSFMPTAVTTMKNVRAICHVINGRTYPITIQGTGSKPLLRFSESFIDFGAQFVFRPGMMPANVTLVVTNTDVKDISLDIVSADVPWMEVLRGLNTLSPGESTSFVVSFFPRDQVVYSGVVRFEVNGLSYVEIPVRGEGVEYRIDADQRQLNLGAMRIGHTAMRTIRVTNKSKLAAQFSIGPIAAIENLASYGLHIPMLEDIVLRPKTSCSIDLKFAPHHRIPPFSEELFVEAPGVTRPLVVISGACQGIEVRLENDTLPFGAVVQKSSTTRRIQLQNTGDVGVKFFWDMQLFVPDFSISPTEGYISPGMEVPLEITFHPTELNPDVRYENIPCEIEGAQSLYLTLTGMCIPQPPQNDTIKFSTPVRSPDTKSISLTNKTNTLWHIRPIIENDYWTGPEVIDIDPGQTKSYDMTFVPLESNGAGEGGRHEGSVFFPLLDGSGILYKLIGTADKPLTAGNINREIPCKTSFTEALSVTNWLKRPQRFRVITEVSKPDPSIVIKGHDFIDVPPLMSKDYKLMFYAYKEGITNIKISFKNESTQECIFYNIMYKSTPPGVISTYDMTTTVRQPLSREVTLYNPLQVPAVFSSASSNPDISVPHAFTIQPKCEGSFSIEFLPLQPRESTSRVTLNSPDLGVYQYDVKLTALQAGPERSLHFKIGLGGSQVQTFRFTSYAKARVDYTCKIESADFSIEKSVSAPAAPSGGVEVSVDITYEPSKLGDTRTQLIVSSPAGGDYVCPLYGHCVAPRPQGPILIKTGAASTLPFKNVFIASATFNFVVDNPAFVVKAAETIAPKKTIQLSIGYKQPAAATTGTGTGGAGGASASGASGGAGNTTSNAAAQSLQNQQAANAAANKNNMSKVGKLTIAHTGSNMTWVYYLKYST